MSELQVHTELLNYVTRIRQADRPQPPTYLSTFNETKNADIIFPFILSL